MPIDIKDLRPEAGGDPDFWRENQRKRFLPPEQVDVVLALDARQRTLAHEIDVQHTAKNTVQAKVRWLCACCMVLGRGLLAASLTPGLVPCHT